MSTIAYGETFFCLLLKRVLIESATSVALSDRGGNARFTLLINPQSFE